MQLTYALSRPSVLQFLVSSSSAAMIIIATWSTVRAAINLNLNFVPHAEITKKTRFNKQDKLKRKMKFTGFVVAFILSLQLGKIRVGYLHLSSVLLASHSFVSKLS